MNIDFQLSKTPGYRDCITAIHEDDDCRVEIGRAVCIAQDWWRVESYLDDSRTAATTGQEAREILLAMARGE